MIVRFSVLLFLLSIILIGCKTTSVTWRKDGGSEQEFKRDNYEFGAVAENNAKKQSSQMYKMCMEVHKYTGTEIDDDALNDKNKQDEQIQKQIDKEYEVKNQENENNRIEHGGDAIQQKIQSEVINGNVKVDPIDNIGFTSTANNEEELKRQEALTEQEKQYLESLKKQENETQKRQDELDKLTRENLLEARKILEDKISMVSVNDVDVLVDVKNKLMWPKSGCIVKSQMSWQESKDYVTGFKYAGYSDWRLPKISELKIAYLVQTKFNDFMNAYYWSSTLDGIDSVEYLDMSNGNIGKIFKTNEDAYLLPVRDLR
jgi:hypothetical protein